MTTSPSSPRPSRSWGILGVGAATITACAVCCAGPILVVLGGIGVTSAIGALWMPTAVLTVAAGLGVLVVRRRTTRAACRKGAAVADLGMPTVGPHPVTEGSKAARR